MAEMYGRVTGHAGVVSATLGPGAINLQLGVADATTNSTPMVALSAQVGSTATTRNPTSSSTWCACSRRSPSGPARCRLRRRSRRWSARRSRPPRPNAPARSTSRSPKTSSEAAADRAGAVARNVVAPEAAVAAHRSTARRRFCARAHARSCSPGTAPRARPPGRRWPDSPRRSASRSRPRSMARACSPTTTRCARHGRIHAPRLRQLRLRRRRPDHRRRLRAAGIRPGPDQPGQRQRDHPHPSVPGRGRRSLHHRRRHRGDLGASLDALAAAAAGRPHAARPPQSAACSRRTRPRPGRRPLPARAGPDRRRHPGRARSRGHRAGRHRRGEDVDGAALPDVRAEHLPDLQRPVHHGLRHCRARSASNSPGPTPGARRHRRRRVPDELPGDRDRASGDGFRSSC